MIRAARPGQNQPTSICIHESNSCSYAPFIWSATEWGHCRRRYGSVGSRGMKYRTTSSCSCSKYLQQSCAQRVIVEVARNRVFLLHGRNSADPGPAESCTVQPRRAPIKFTGQCRLHALGWQWVVATTDWQNALRSVVSRNTCCTEFHSRMRWLIKQSMQRW